MPQISILDMSLKITNLRLKPHPLGAYKFIVWSGKTSELCMVVLRCNLSAPWAPHPYMAHWRVEVSRWVGGWRCYPVSTSFGAKDYNGFRCIISSPFIGPNGLGTFPIMSCMDGTSNRDMILMKCHHHVEGDAYGATQSFSCHNMYTQPRAHCGMVYKLVSHLAQWPRVPFH